MNPFAVLSIVVQAIPSIIKATRGRISKRPPPVYNDEHHWSDHAPKHCIYCKQSQAVAERWCPGMPKTPSR
jgi:hypothetical protein